MNYESELSEVLLNGLKDLYGIKDETVLYHYFYLRFLIIEKPNRISINDYDIRRKFIKCILEELNLPLIKERVNYKGVDFSLHYRDENSLDNIVTNWHFRGSLYSIKTVQGRELAFDEYIKQEYQKLLRHGKNKAKAFKNTLYYEAYLNLHALELLNKQYNAKIGQPSIIKDIEYPENHNFFKRSLEERYKAEIHSFEFLTNNTATITEADLEKYLVRNLNVLEDGLKFIERQVVIEDGRIDILAKDKKDNYVIIELKVVEDKEVVYQSIYYPLQFKRERGLKNVRMMVVAPRLPECLLVTLKQIPDIEIYQFSLLIEIGKIKDINIKKVS